jgi:peptidoglycan L-alanyl-D-glutamate endopeptidase CwlK
MPAFSSASLDKLATCHPDLQVLFNKVIQGWDCTILEGYRDQEGQNKAFIDGNSKLQWPDGKHNKMPSNAVDVAPYPIDWEDESRFCFFAGFVLGVADELKRQRIITHDIRWGGDWNSDKQVKDNKFNDRVHYEIIE